MTKRRAFHHGGSPAKRSKYNEGNHMIRQLRAARGFSGLRLHRKRQRIIESSMQVDSGPAGGSDGKSGQHEAKMVPGLGSLEWGFPNSIVTTLRYADVYTLTSTTGATTSQVWRANGCFDPDQTGGGHQPLFFDEWAAVYNYYTVLGSKIKVTLHNASDYAGTVCLQGSSTSSLSSTVSLHLEQNNGVNTIIGNKYAEPITMFMTYSPEENMGQDVKNDGSSMTAVTADPSSGEGTYFYGLLLTTVSANTSVVTAQVEIEYTVKFSLLKKNGGS